MNSMAWKRRRLRIIIPAYPASNIYFGSAQITTALGPVLGASPESVTLVNYSSSFDITIPLLSALIALLSRSEGLHIRLDDRKPGDSNIKVIWTTKRMSPWSNSTDMDIRLFFHVMASISAEWYLVFHISAYLTKRYGHLFRILVKNQDNSVRGVPVEYDLDLINLCRCRFSFIV